MLPSSHLPDEGDLEFAAPSRRLRIKSKVRFVDLDDEDLSEVERCARVFLLEDDFSDTAFRVIIQLLRDCERPSTDRRGDLQEKFVFGAFCHGGNRGVTSLAKRRPHVTRFLNHFLRRRLTAQQFDDPLEWSAVMILRGTEVEEHKDVRNEWGSFNYLLCVPGGLELQITNPGGKENEVLPLGSQAAKFDARKPHLVRRNPDWFIVGYTPLGTPKIRVEEKRNLCELGFRLNERDISQFEIRVVSAKGDSDDASSATDSSLPDLEPVDAGPGQQDLPHDSGEPSSEVSLEQDMQVDSVTQLIGWDPSQGEGHNYPVQNLEETDLQQYLDDRGVGWTFRRLVTLGVEMASDLAFLFQEDLVEFGMPPQDARRIMIGIHPAGTVRPDNPNLSSLTSGEVRLIDRQHRQIPWVIQNRTLSLKSPGAPAYGLGVRDPRLGPEAYEEDWVVSEERRRNEERWIRYTELPDMSASSSTALPPLGTESVDFPSAQVQTLDVFQGNNQVPPQGDSWFSDYEGYAEYAMAMQAMWDEEEGPSDIGEGSGVLSDTVARPPLDTESVDFPAQVPTPSEGYCSVPPVRSGPCAFDSVPPVRSGPCAFDSVPPVRSGPEAICSVPPVRSGLQDSLVVSTTLSRKKSWPLSLRRVGREQRPRASSEPAPIVRAVEAVEPESPARSLGAAQIRVPTLHRVSIRDVWDEAEPEAHHSIRRGRSTESQGRYGVRKVDEDFYTPNVEELLQGLIAPLKVVHNVATSEVRRHLDEWRSSAADEVNALEGMQGIKRLKGQDAVVAASAEGVQVLPAKTVFTAKPGSGDKWFRRKCRVVGCGNFERPDPELELFASGVPADVLRACLIEAAHRGFSAWISDIKNAFLLAPLPDEVGLVPTAGHA